MGRGWVSMTALYTLGSVSGLAWRITSTTHHHHHHHHHESENENENGNGSAVFESPLSTALLANFVFACFMLLAIFLKVLFFGQLSKPESQKLVERLINYVLFKGLFLAWVVRPEATWIYLWLAWLVVLGFLKMFQGLARDRLEQLNASPTATLLSHARVFSVLVFVLFSDVFWIQFCIFIFKGSRISTLLLLLFEPLSIALDTTQAIVVHGMQLLDTWHRQSVDTASPHVGLQRLERSAAGAAWERRRSVVQNCTFFMDIINLFLALCHCLHIWWLRGLAFQVVDGILFMNLRALLSAILKRIKTFMKLKTAMSTLQGALPDATDEELFTYDDDCAICKEPMAKAKRLPCAHLFHLPCLRSWLDQGVAETYSCPTCRRPLFMGTRRMTGLGLQRGDGITEIVEEDLIARNNGPSRGQAMDDIHQPASISGNFSTQQWNLTDSNSWRSELPPEAIAGGGEGSSADTMTPIQIMMRHVSGRSYLQNHRSHEGGTWRWWPFNHHTGGNYHQTNASSISRNGGMTLDLRSRNAVELQIGAMAQTVREVLPHISEEIIIQDLRRTNSVTATVNNLL